MNPRSARACYILPILCLAITLSACGGTPTPQAQPVTSSPTAAPPEVQATAASTPTPSAESQAPVAATPTLTTAPAAVPQPTAPKAASRCEGLVGQLEIQILVGPAEAAGLEPVAVGSLPFAVTTSGPPYLVEGQGPISYEATLVQQWGSYAVTMDMQTAVQGECSGEAGRPTARRDR